MEINLEYVKKRFEVMDAVRKDLKELWDDNYNRVMASLERTDEEGDELNEVNINQSMEKSYTVAQFLAEIFFYKLDFFHFKARASDDIDSAKVIRDYIQYFMTTIPAIRELGFKWALQATIKGFSPAKIVPYIQNGVLQKIKFFPIHTNDIWLDPTWGIGLIEDLFHEIRLSEEDLQFFVEEGLYCGDMVDQFLEETKDLPIKDPREKDYQTEGKTLPSEQHENKKAIKEYWFKKEDPKTGEDKWFLQVWGTDGDGNLKYRLRPKDEDKEADLSPYWFGHGFLFGIDIPALYNVAGLGEPYLIKDYANAITRIINQKLDYFDIAVNPPILISKYAYSEDSELDALANPKLGGFAVLDKIGPGYVDFFRMPTVAPEAQWMLKFLMETGEKGSLRTDYLGGYGSRTQEPATTTMTNLSQAMKGINFRAWVLGWALQELGQKLLICVQQYGSKEDVIRITGREGYNFIKIDKTKRKRGEKILTNTVRQKTEYGEIYEEQTIKLQANKKEALKFYDIEVTTSIEEVPEVLARRAIEAITLFSKVPQFQDANMIELGKQVLEAWGFKNVDTILPEQDQLSPEMSRLLAKIPAQYLIELLRRAGVLGKLNPEFVPKEIRNLSPQEIGQGKMEGMGAGNVTQMRSSQRVANISNLLREARSF